MYTKLSRWHCRPPNNHPTICIQNYQDDTAVPPMIIQDRQCHLLTFVYTHTKHQAVMKCRSWHAYIHTYIQRIKQVWSAVPDIHTYIHIHTYIGSSSHRMPFPSARLSCWCFCGSASRFPWFSSAHTSDSSVKSCKYLYRLTLSHARSPLR